MLGANAPEPLQKNSLSQAIMWDGKDDAGQLAGAGPHVARVRVGLKPTLDGMIGDNPGYVYCPQGLAVGPKGELFVLQIFGRVHPEDNSSACAVYDRGGKYLRTILPYPADLPESKLAGIKRIELASGAKAPFIYNGETRAILAGAGNVVAHQPVVTADGMFVFVGHGEKPKGTQLRYNSAGIKQVTAINADGSMPAGGPYRTVLASSSEDGGALAAAPDGKTFYATGIGDNKKPGTVVWRFGLEDKTPAVFAEGFKAPAGVAVDKDGNVYVAENDAGQIAVLSPAGQAVGALKVDKPKQVAVNPKTGAVYVVTEDKRVLKFASWKESQPAAETKLPLATAAAEHKALLIAVDASAEPVVVWAGIGGGRYSSGDLGKNGLWRIEETAAGFSAPVNINTLAGNDKPAAGPMLSMALDRVNNRLLIGPQVHDLASGKWSTGISGMVGRQSGTGDFGLDGNLYVQSFYNQTARYSPDLKPLPFAAGAGGQIVHPKGGAGEIRSSGATADPAGNVYLLWNKAGKPNPGDVLHAHSLAMHKPDGSVANEELVNAQIRQLCSPRVDAQGNIYLGIGIRPAGKRMPDGLKGDFGKVWSAARPPADELEWYELLYGCIVKFGPEGGAVRPGIGGTPMEYSWSGDPKFKIDLKGAKWFYFGVSPLVSWRNGAPDVCFCESPRFDVDLYGRSFFPDAARFRCGILDTAGNEICTFGAYGNPDSAGPKSAIPTPEIPMFWPYMIAAGDGVVYVGDRLNRRVVVVRLGYAESAKCEMR
jgi:DNA-binding beta-propeller fold protein YncE